MLHQRHTAPTSAEVIDQTNHRQPALAQRLHDDVVVVWGIHCSLLAELRLSIYARHRLSSSSTSGSSADTHDTRRAPGIQHSL
jgi:hypothetical protein